MATRRLVIYIASCDVCGEEADPGSGQGLTRREAIDDLTVHDGTWTEVSGGRLICDRSDPSHDHARGGDSPALLVMTSDAMTAQFPNPATEGKS